MTSFDESVFEVFFNQLINLSVNLNIDHVVRLIFSILGFPLPSMYRPHICELSISGFDALRTRAQHRMRCLPS
jgi:hypothetical protein